MKKIRDNSSLKESFVCKLKANETSVKSSNKTNSWQWKKAGSEFLIASLSEDYFDEKNSCLISFLLKFFKLVDHGCMYEAKSF